MLLNSFQLIYIHFCLKIATNLRNHIRLSSIEIQTNDSRVSTLEINSIQEYYSRGAYSVPYYSRPRQCVHWTISTTNELWIFKLNQLVDINYVQIVLHFDKNLQESVQSFRLVIDSGGRAEAEDNSCQLLKHRIKRNYLTMDYSCTSGQTLNQRVGSIGLSYKSQHFANRFSISLCELRVYRLPIDCGSPDYSLSAEAVNRTRNEFAFHCRDNNHIIEGEYCFLLLTDTY